MKPTVGVFRRFFPTVFWGFSGLSFTATERGHNVRRRSAQLWALEKGEDTVLVRLEALAPAAVHGTCGTSELTLTKIDYKIL